jgi:hypothetical protein
MTTGELVARPGWRARAAAEFRRYWTRGEAGRPTPEPLVVTLHLLWLLAMLGKLLGSSWDVSWHFRWLRDDLAPPHLVNTCGTGLAILLVVFHTFTGYGADRRTLRLLQWGIGVFLIAAPLDVINHRINGLDLTSWSPSHALLYLGTAIMQAGVVLGWVRLFPRRPLVAPKRWLRWPAAHAYRLGLGALFLLFFENVWFPNGQQEYGVLEVASWDRGHPYAEPSLLAFAANQIGHPVNRASVLHFALPIPPWVYPLWSLVAGGLVLVVARRVLGGRWSATLVAGGYVAYRCVIWLVLVGAHFPPSAVPLFAVLLGVAVDLAARFSGVAASLLGAVLVTGLGLAGLWAQGALVVAPPVDFRVAPVVLVLLAAGWWAALRFPRRAAN